MTKINFSKEGLLLVTISVCLSCSPATPSAKESVAPSVPVGGELELCRDCPTFIRVPSVSSFSRKVVYVAKYELTWKQYIASVDDGTCRMAFAPQIGDSILEPRRDFDAEFRGRDKYRIDWPVVTLDLTELSCYLSWLQTKTRLRVSLPTGSEWESIARAGRSGVKYPWGNDSDETHEALSGTRSTTPSSPEIQSLWRRGIIPYGVKVGSYAPNPWGIHDLMGNANELISFSEPHGRTELDLTYAPRTSNIGKDVESVLLKGASFSETDWKAEGISRVRYSLIWKGRFSTNVGIRFVLIEEN